MEMYKKPQTQYTHIGGMIFMKGKIFLTLIALLLLTIGVVAAATIDDFQTPTGWEPTGNGMYNGPTEEEGLWVMTYNTADVQEYLTPSSTLKINKQPDNTIIFDDTKNKEHGVAEVVTKDGSKYIVMVWATDKGMSDSDLMNVMLEFNNLNNVKPGPM